MAGCSTSYQSEAFGLTGGYTDVVGPGRLHYVTFLGNGFTQPHVSQGYALYRAAEIAQLRGKPYFLMYDSLHGAANNIPTTVPRVGTMINWSTASAFILPLDNPHPQALETRATLTRFNPANQGGTVQ